MPHRWHKKAVAAVAHPRLVTLYHLLARRLVALRFVRPTQMVFRIGGR